MIISPHTFELTLICPQRKFSELLASAYENALGHHRVIQKKGKSIEYGIVHEDKALASYGISFEYQHNHFLAQNRIRVVVNPSKVLGGDDIPKLWKPTDRNIKALLRDLN